MEHRKALFYESDPNKLLDVNGDYMNIHMQR